MKKITALRSLLLLAVCSTLTLTSCRKSHEDDTQPAALNNGGGTSDPTASISGKVTTPSGRIVGFASVSVGSHSTHTNYLGEFSLTIPTGSQVLTIQTGKGNIFKRTVPVNLSENQSFRLADTSCVLTQVGQMMAVHGDYDVIEAIIISLGYTVNIVGSAQLPLSYLDTYDAVFLNCTANNMMMTPYYQNLDTFVRHGGSIYASDWAVEYLTGNGAVVTGGSGSERREGHHVVNPQASCLYPLPGGFLADTSLCTTKSGSSGYANHVNIYDAGLVSALGKDSIDIVYDLGSWEMIDHIDAPFVITMQKPGYPGIAAAKADMSLYYPGAGSITYTTFHNNPQTSVSPDVMTVLQYFILNL
jgi:hypothetical protein